MTQSPITQDSRITEPQITKEEMDRKCKEAEEKFKEWLNKHNIPFIFFDQTVKSFSDEFNKENLKRPDFMVLIPNFGSILVDVKYKTKNNFGTITLNEKEIEKFINFNKNFGVHIWFAVSNEESNFSSWHWISANELDEIELKTNTSTKERFYPVPVQKFYQISGSEGLEKLFENKK